MNVIVPKANSPFFVQGATAKSVDTRVGAVLGGERDEAKRSGMKGPATLQRKKAENKGQKDRLSIRQAKSSRAFLALCELLAQATAMFLGDQEAAEAWMLALAIKAWTTAPSDLDLLTSAAGAEAGPTTPHPDGVRGFYA